MQSACRARRAAHGPVEGAETPRVSISASFYKSKTRSFAAFWNGPLFAHAAIMKLKAGCELFMSAADPVPLVAMLRPRSGEAQWIISERYELDPFVRAVEYVDGFGNLCQRLTAPAGKFRIMTEVLIEVTDVIAVGYGAPATPAEALPDYALQFLLPSRYCPSDMMEKQAKEITHGKSECYDQVESIRAWIHEH